MNEFHHTLPNSGSSNDIDIHREERCEAQDREDKVARKTGAFGAKTSICEVVQSLWVATGIRVSDNPGQGQEMWMRK